MKSNQLMILQLLKMAIWRAKPSPVIDVNIEAYNCVVRYGLKAILFPLVEDKFLIFSKNTPIIDDWTKYIQKNVMLNLLFIQQVSNIINLFKEAKVTPIILKGLSIACLYEKPEYRLMEDLDLFVVEDEWEEAKKTLIADCYIQEEDDDYHPMHIKFTKKGGINIELHRKLIHTGYLGNRQANVWYEHIWKEKKITFLEGLEFYSLSIEDELINQITHFSAHFVYYGTRLKHFFEIALIISKNNGIDWEYIRNALKTLDLFKFGCLIFSVCSTYFGIEIPSYFDLIYKNKQYKFMSDFINYFSIERLPDIQGYLSILCNHRMVFKRRILYQTIIWFIEFKSQISIKRLYNRSIFCRAFRNIISINKKISFIRRYNLLFW